MTKLSRNFVAGRMNKMYDQRVVPNGEYIDALNIRMGSTEKSEVGVIENTKGNLLVAELRYIDGTALSDKALCIGTYADTTDNAIYWFVHDPEFTVGDTGKLDLIVSYNVLTNILTYHVVSIKNQSDNTNTTLNFNSKYLITGVSMIENLLFFTDDYNPPRCINVTRNYANPIGNVDQFSAESLLVIKKPPIAAPTVQPINIGGQSNYMDTRFISFAYRYLYADNQYSATSQWSDISFIPKSFGFVDDSYLNSGMENSCNAAIVTYNSGGPLVVGIDLLFKQSDGNIIKVIEKINKKDSGLVDDTEYSFTFSNSKIFTILPESELLRLYDNVPLLAKAQTIMGNRLMYGNYVEGYDMLDSDGYPVKLEYETSLVSVPISSKTLDTTFTARTYPLGGSVYVPNSVLNIDLTGVSLQKGSSISIDLILTHNQFSVTPPAPQDQTLSVPVSFKLVLNNSYSSVYAFATSVEFQNAIGTVTNIQSVYPDNSCNGTTLTDLINCQIPTVLNGYTKYGSGDSAIYQPVTIVTSPSSSIISLTMVAMEFVDNPSSVTSSFIEYYSISFAQVLYQKDATPRSLHSNRDYEIGIVYMDEFGRSTTALVSPFNTEHTPCSSSDLQNEIFVTIPPTQRPPYWATRYKFVCKPDAEGYETIISSIYFIDPINPNSCYVLVEGENARKVEVGDKLIVKTDTSGAVNSCQYVTVLDKQSYGSGFITPVSGANVPAGVYLKISLNNITIVEIPDAIPPTPTISDAGYVNDCPEVKYPVSIEGPPGTWTPYTVPIGSKIKLSFKFKNYKYDYVYEKEFTSSSNYNTFEDWWIGDQIALTLNDGDLNGINTNCTQVNNVFISGHGIISNCDICTNYYRFDVVSSELLLRVKGCKPAVGGLFPSTVKVKIEVYRSAGILVFETEPTDSLPDVFYENNLSFAIEDGNHFGNVQNQDILASTPAIVNTGFFNCFSFGNGVESYKVFDSLVGHSFSLGQRVTSTASQDYGRVDRATDITYSGVYNTETNINKLNEFNLGLADFKNLEASFGPIYILDGRETDVLVLQEDKISYVLAGKNLLSDSTGGGAVSSVPEVLGTQIARTEKYGISFNPESYVQWGYDRYFTDVKRGAVIQLKGTSYSDEQLAVISDMNMRTWFRDTFIDSFSTQKLGAFDPYMDEYVLSINDRALPFNPSCLACGVSQNFILSSPIDQEAQKVYCVNLGDTVGSVNVNYNVISLDPSSELAIIVNYNGNITTNYISEVGSGTFAFPKDLNYVDTAEITIVSIGNIQIDITVDCPYTEMMGIVQVVVANDSQSGQSIHTQYRYFDGPYVSPLQSSSVTFASGTNNPLVSYYNLTYGVVGTGSVPTVGSVVRIQTNKIPPDTYDFSPLNDKFRCLRSDTLYNNTPSEIASLLADSSLVPVVSSGPGINYGEFLMPPGPGYFLYLIWDFRKSATTELCYSEIIDDVCCGCAPCELCELIHIDAGEAPCQVYFPNGFCGDDPNTPVTIDLEAGQFYENCFNPTQEYVILSGTPNVERVSCGCSYCASDCSKWVITSNGLESSIFKVQYYNCSGVLTLASVTAPYTNIICVQRGTTPVGIDGTGTIDLFEYCSTDDCCSYACSKWQVTTPSSCLVAYTSCNGTFISTTITSTTIICAQQGNTPTIIGPGTLSLISNCVDPATCP